MDRKNRKAINVLAARAEHYHARTTRRQTPQRPLSPVQIVVGQMPCEFFYLRPTIIVALDFGSIDP